MYKLTVPVTDVLRIHEVACLEWKSIIRLLLCRVDHVQNITFTENEIESMCGAATEQQAPLLKEIFGEKEYEIDYDRLKTGSKVMIANSGSGNRIYSDVNMEEPVDILFYCTPHYINSFGVFSKTGYYQKYVVFVQKGKFAVFNGDKGINFITEVIEY